MNGPLRNQPPLPNDSPNLFKFYMAQMIVGIQASVVVLFALLVPAHVAWVGDYVEGGMLGLTMAQLSMAAVWLVWGNDRPVRRFAMMFLAGVPVATTIWILTDSESVLIDVCLILAVIGLPQYLGCSVLLLALRRFAGLRFAPPRSGGASPISRREAAAIALSLAVLGVGWRSIAPNFQGLTYPGEYFFREIVHWFIATGFFGAMIAAAVTIAVFSRTWKSNLTFAVVFAAVLTAAERSALSLIFEPDFPVDYRYYFILNGILILVLAVHLAAARWAGCRLMKT